VTTQLRKGVHAHVQVAGSLDAARDRSLEHRRLRHRLGRRLALELSPAHGSVDRHADV
jgi:hypothetical protein